MNIKKRAKLKSNRHFSHYKAFGWMWPIVYVLKDSSRLRRYIASGKYKKHAQGEPYKIFEGYDVWVVDVLVSSTVKKSRVKNVPYGCEGVPMPALSEGSWEQGEKLTSEDANPTAALKALMLRNKKDI